MNWFWSVVLASLSSFIATNIDDIIILMLFFAQIDLSFRPRHIIIGQYLGFTFLIIASLPGLIGGLVIPKTWMGLLGIVPILIGIKSLFDSDRNQQVQTVTDSSTLENSTRKKSFLKRFLSIQTYQVAAVTVANGGDNIGIYVPFFANISLLGFAITLAIFYLMIAVWCAIAYQLTRHPTLARLLTRFGKRFVPFILIGLGFFILIESKTYQLLQLL